jgi:hypothetical protein
LRIKGNPSFKSVPQAVEAAEKFVHELIEAHGNATKSPKTKTIQNIRSKEIIETKVGKHVKKQTTKKYKLRYWLDTRICYFSDDYKDIVNHSTENCDQGTSWGTHSFYIELTSNKKIDYLLNEKFTHSFGIEEDYNYLKYENYCDGLGTLEIQTKDPHSLAPYKVKYGLIQSVIDSESNVFEIYDGNFCGDIVEYDYPEVDQGYFIVSGNNMLRAQDLNGRIVPED